MKNVSHFFLSGVFDVNLTNVIRSPVCLFVLLLNVPVNIYGHVGIVSSPNHTFSWAGLTQQLTSTLCAYVRL